VGSSITIELLASNKDIIAFAREKCYSGMERNCLGAGRMKRICFFSGDITRSGGTEKVATLIANELAKQGKYEISFLSLTQQREEPFFEISPKISRYSLGNRWIQPGPGYLALLPRLRKFLREQGIDVIIDIDIVLDALTLPVRGKTKVVSWGHFSYYFEQESLYRRLILRYGVKRAHYCITINEENRACYERYLHRTQAVRTIYNPAVKTGEVVSEKENWILWAGRLVTEKGVDEMAETARLTLEGHPGWKWIVAGDGPKRDWLQGFIQRHGLEGRLVPVGRVSNMWEYYEKAKIHVLTSTKTEGLPMCLLEAKSHGLPIVSFDIHSGPGEIVRDGVNGFLIPPRNCREMAEKLGELMEKEELRKRFSENTALDMEKFSLEAIVDSWNEVIDSLCG